MSVRTQAALAERAAPARHAALSPFPTPGSTAPLRIPRGLTAEKLAQNHVESLPPRIVARRRTGTGHFQADDRYVCDGGLSRSRADLVSYD